MEIVFCGSFLIASPVGSSDNYHMICPIAVRTVETCGLVPGGEYQCPPRRARSDATPPEYIRAPLCRGTSVGSYLRCDGHLDKNQKEREELDRIPLEKQRKGKAMRRRLREEALVLTGGTSHGDCHMPNFHTAAQRFIV